MTPQLLTEAGQASCADGGTVQLTASTQVLTVSGSPALVVTDLTGATVTGCSTPTSTGPPPTKACLVTVAATSGASTLLRVNGAPVALATAAGATDGVAIPKPPAGAAPPPPGPSSFSVGSAGQGVVEVES